MLTAIIQFPGSNCDQDCAFAIERVGGTVAWAWHDERALPSNVQAVILPGGFSYGDYLRSGAMAARSPIMQAVRVFAERGGLVLGICNGFQILTEAGLLPGALLRNRDLRFVCRTIHVQCARTDTPFTTHVASVAAMPIAHMDGCYYADAETLAQLASRQQIIFRYCTPDGVVDDRANPNGSCAQIAGICNEAGNVLGLMPHPERVVDALLGGEDGLGIFHSMMRGAL